MRRRILTLTLGLCAAGSLLADSNNEVEAHKTATGVAGAFTNDGFKLRDGHWNGQIEKGKAHLIQVNLYAGNQYWFTVGTSPAAKQVAVTVYDEAGKALHVEPYVEEGKAAAGFSPEASGPYFIKVEEKEGTPTTFCLIYSYK